MSKRTAQRLFNLCATALPKLCITAIFCALATAATIHAQTRRTRAASTPTSPGQTSRARTASQSSAPSSTSTAPAPSPESAPSPSVPEEDADLVIIANVQAKELRFDVVPNPTVEFPGKPRRETEWSAERTNLPQQVQPGVTYRDIGIRLKIVSRFADIERIVAEALGEIPASDDAPRNSSTINTEPDAASARAATGSEVRAAATPNETAQPAVGSSSPSSRTGGGRVAPKRKARAHGARRSG